MKKKSNLWQKKRWLDIVIIFFFIILSILFWTMFFSWIKGSFILYFFLTSLLLIDTMVKIKTGDFFSNTKNKKLNMFFYIFKLTMLLFVVINVIFNVYSLSELLYLI